MDALAVDELFAVIGLQQQPVTSGHFQFAGLADIEGGGDIGRDETCFRAIGTAHTQTVFLRGDHFHGVGPVKMFGQADEAEALAGHELAGVFFCAVTAPSSSSLANALSVCLAAASSTTCRNAAGLWRRMVVSLLKR